ncbi:MAG: hypothetical protein PSW75_03925 [bacterium]|nr:hypothetical protein [bacterium]MDI1335204.1 hypothetical protein [Lacunisphaera sp.]
MSEYVQTTASSFLPRWAKRGLVVLVGLVVLLAVSAFLMVKPWTPKFRHQRVLGRIEGHLKPIMVTMPVGDAMQRLPKVERGRCEIIRAIWAALYNWPLYYQAGTVPEKVVAIADRLDANGGADLKTFEGCVELLKLFDEASWTFYDYPWVATLSEMEQEGMIPKLPVLGERWKNDPRRKEWESSGGRTR